MRLSKFLGLFVLLAILAPMTLSSCSSNVQKDAIRDKIETWANNQKKLEVTSIKWIGSEEIGSPSTPETKYGLEVTFKITGETFSPVYRLDWLQVSAIKSDLPKGHELTRTMTAKVRRKDGKIEVNISDYPSLESHLLDYFTEDGTKKDEIIIKGKTDSSKAFAKLLDFQQTNTPIFDKIQSELETLTDTQRTLASSDKALSLKKIKEEIEIIERHAEKRKDMASEERRRKLEFLLETKYREESLKCKKSCERVLARDPSLRRRAQQQLGMNFEYLYCEINTVSPSPEVRQCLETLNVAQGNETNKIEGAYKDTIAELMNRVSEANKRYDDERKTFEEYERELSTRRNKLSHELNELRWKLRDVNNAIELAQ